MSKIVKKGFSMIELLFVMVILAALAAIAIPNMQGGERAAAITSSFSDAKNIINLIQSKYIETQNYEDIFDTSSFGGLSLNNGYSEQALRDGTKIPLSDNTYATVYAVTVGDCKGFRVQVIHDILSHEYKAVRYNSCTMSGPKLVDNGG